MSQFYCREDERRKLNKRYAGDKFECIVIYGRRRVGKTALINEFCKDKPTIFFSALNTTGKENLEALSKSIMSFERPDMESAPEFRSYDAALDELTALSKEKRIVFVIDITSVFNYSLCCHEYIVYYKSLLAENQHYLHLRGHILCVFFHAIENAPPPGRANAQTHNN